MTDIVWLLRNDVPCGAGVCCAGELCNQAADEIERLRAALRDIRDMGPMTVDDQRWRIAKNALEEKQ